MLRDWDRSLGTRHTGAIEARLGLGRALLAQHRLEEAAVHLTGARETARTSLRAGHPLTLAIGECLGRLHLERGDPEQACALFGQLLERGERNLPAGNRLLRVLREDLGPCR